MLTQIYIQALLVDEELADQVWEAWDAGEVDEAKAFLGWWCSLPKTRDGANSEGNRRKIIEQTKN